MPLFRGSPGSGDFCLLPISREIDDVIRQVLDKILCIAERKQQIENQLKMRSKQVKQVMTFQFDVNLYFLLFPIHCFQNLPIFAAKTSFENLTADLCL